MDKPHQRIGSISNAHVGADFERAALLYFASIGIVVKRNYPLDIGFAANKVKRHCFDLGSDDPKIIIECKSHRWTIGGKVPSAKMTTWNEAMLYFHLAPREYRKIFFTIRDIRPRTGQSLVDYYKHTYSHFIPDGIEFMEYDEVTGGIYEE